MKQRVLVPELMDDPQLDPVEHIRALRGLRRINAWTGNASLVWKPIWQLAQAHRDRPLRVLDIATGSADIPIALARRAARRGIKLEIDACDISDQAIAFAETAAASATTGLRLFQHDILHQEIPQQYDVVMCSQFLHHLTEAQTSEVLAKMAAAATRRVVVVDLVRSRWNWLQVWLATRVLSRSKVVHFDGPQSIRAALTRDELRALAEPCGFRALTIGLHWPCRMMLLGEVANDA